MPSSPGSYVLFVTLSNPTLIEVGRLGSVSFDAGIYAYVGSAFGPGGLAARLGRYIAGPVRKHWHIDYLLVHGEVSGALVSTDTARLECEWATWLRNRCSKPIRGFGASDCGCDSHLFFIASQTKLEEIISAAGYDLKTTYLERRSLMARTDLVHCRNPDPEKQGVNVPRWKYEAVRNAITKVLQERPGGVEFKSLPSMVRGKLNRDELARLGSVPWHTTVVKLHLETIAEIERIPDTRPQMIRATAPEGAATTDGE